MAHETKIGLLISLALILLVGLVLSDLFSGGENEAVERQAPTDFGGEVQAGIYPQPPSAIYSDTELNALGADPNLGTPLRAEPAQGFEPPRQRSAPNETRIPARTPSRDSEPPTPELDTMQARQSEALATIDATLEMFKLDNQLSPASERLSVDQRNAPAVHQLAADPTEADLVRPTSDAPTLPTTTVGSVTIHTVQVGQTLAGIARQHYGNPEYAHVLAMTNPNKLDRDGGVRPGVRLEIPPLGSPVFSRVFQPVHAEHAPQIEEAMPTLPRRPADQREAALTEITVQPGDTLSELAYEHLGSSSEWEQLLTANSDRLESPQSLRSGMKLRIPSQEDRATTISPSDAVAHEAREVREAEEDVSPEVRRKLDTASSPTYTVQAGDNLTRIAAKLLGDGERWDELMNANVDQLDAPENLRAGMVLKLPADGNGQVFETRAEVADATPNTTERPAAASVKNYIVQAGDNLTRIAARQLGDGERWRELYEANADQLASPDALFAGQTLRLP